MGLFIKDRKNQKTSEEGDHVIDAPVTDFMEMVKIMEFKHCSSIYSLSLIC